MKKARLRSLGLAYLSPQNKSLAQSFRYMRNKPTIIAFKTPSLENCEQRASQQSIGSMSNAYIYHSTISMESYTFQLHFQLYHQGCTLRRRQKKEEFFPESQEIPVSALVIDIRILQYKLMAIPFERHIR